MFWFSFDVKLAWIQNLDDVDDIFLCFFLNMFFVILLKKILVHVAKNGQRIDCHRFKYRQHNSEKRSTWSPIYQSTYARGGSWIDYKLKHSMFYHNEGRISCKNYCIWGYECSQFRMSLGLVWQYSLPIEKLCLQGLRTKHGINYVSSSFYVAFILC